MNELVFNNNGKPATTSLIVAQIFGKNHSDVLRDIRNLHCSDEFKESNFALMVEMRELPQGGATQTKHYQMTKDGFSFLVMGYTGDKAGKFKEDFINAFNKYEQIAKNPVANLTKIDLAQMVIESEREKERLQLQNQAQAQELQKQAPKVAYFDEVLQSQSTYNVNQIAKELGMSAVTLNRKLHDMGVQYKQGGTWLLYHKYQDKGYTKTDTYTHTDSNGQTRSSMLTVWTEKGRQFIHSLNIK